VKDPHIAGVLRDKGLKACQEELLVKGKSHALSEVEKQLLQTPRLIDASEGLVRALDPAAQQKIWGVQLAALAAERAAYRAAASEVGDVDKLVREKQEEMNGLQHNRASDLSKEFADRIAACEQRLQGRNSADEQSRLSETLEQLRLGQEEFKTNQADELYVSQLKQDVIARELEEFRKLQQQLLLQQNQAEVNAALK
jgi:hypothetical protein